MTRKGRERQELFGGEAVLTITDAADGLPMTHGEAVRWLKDHELVHDLGGRAVVIWGDVLEVLRGRTPARRVEPRVDRWATVGRSPLR